MKIENEIISSVIAAVKELYGQDVPEKMVALQKTKSNFEGNLTPSYSHSSRCQRKSLRIQHRKSANT